MELLVSLSIFMEICHKIADGSLYRKNVPSYTAALCWECTDSNRLIIESLAN